MTVREAAERLGLHPDTVYDLIRCGRLSCYRIGLRGGRISVSEQHVTEYLASCEHTGIPHDVKLKHIRIT